ncbi:hypothetical protein V8B97DRAFT_1878731, partial [Scleroderma yunnanense]
STLDICNSDGTLMVLVCMEMPPELKNMLMSNLVGAFDGGDVFYECQEAHGAQPFQCAHFSWYN